MSFFSDLVHGNFGNLGTDLSHDPVGTGIGAGALLLGTAGLAAPEIFAGLGAFGGAEAAGGIGASSIAMPAAEGGLDLAAAGGGEAAFGGGFGADVLAGGAGGDVLGAGFPTAMTTAGPPNVFAGSPFLDLSSAVPGAGGGFGDAVAAGGSGTNLIGGGGADVINLAGSDVLNVGDVAGKAGGFDLGSWLSTGISKTNPLSLGLAGAGLGYQVLQGQRDLPSTNALKQQNDRLATESATLTNTGQQLQSYLTNGNLPPNLQAQVTEQVKAAKARIIANHAANGRPTDPTHNSALAQELNGADMQGLQLAGSIEQNLFQSGQGLINAGIQVTGMSDTLLTTLSSIDRQQTRDMGQSIANFAAALNGGRPGINIGGARSTDVTVS